MLLTKDKQAWLILHTFNALQAGSISKCSSFIFRLFSSTIRLLVFFGLFHSFFLPIFCLFKRHIRIVNSRARLVSKRTYVQFFFGKNRQMSKKKSHIIILFVCVCARAFSLSCHLYFISFVHLSFGFVYVLSPYVSA